MQIYIKPGGPPGETVQKTRRGEALQARPGRRVHPFSKSLWLKPSHMGTPTAKEPGSVISSCAHEISVVLSLAQREVRQETPGKGSSLIKRDFEEDVTFFSLGILSTVDMALGAAVAALPEPAEEGHGE